MSLETSRMVATMAGLGRAMNDVHAAFLEFGQLRRTAEGVARTRKLRDDPTFAPYRLESAEERAARRRRLHESRADEE